MSSIVGVAHVTLYLEDSFSLKDKRQVVRSITQKVRNQFNAGIAEVEGLDEAPVEADEVDPDVHRFRTLHGALHDAMFAVIEISRGEIREFE